MGAGVQQVESAVEDLEGRYGDRLVVNPDIDRRMVSFQANKREPIFRWFNFKEAFSAALVSYLTGKFRLPPSANVLDPFAGSGTTLFPAAEAGYTGVGIEILPVAVTVILARKAAMCVEVERLVAAVDGVKKHGFDACAAVPDPFDEVPITKAAFPAAAAQELLAYRTYVESEVSDPLCKQLLHFAALCVLERISYTRKDGQYLRWDARARAHGGSFRKEEVAPFEAALLGQIGRMCDDLFSLRGASLRAAQAERVQVFEGSCLGELPQFAEESMDAVITSPPYCNRYDYTRTYALELVYLGYGAEEIKALRQNLLSCTVENRPKDEYLESLYCAQPGILHRAREAFEQQEALQAILEALDSKRQNGELNNPSVCRLVRNYFMEMSVVIHELARVVRPGAPVVMVNDNVRYAGITIPVDLILSDIASLAGLDPEVIWVLPGRKGNSSQQMARHGRDALRKCVYVWRKQGG